MAPSHVRIAARLYVMRLTGESAGRPLRSDPKRTQLAFDLSITRIRDTNFVQAQFCSVPAWQKVIELFL